MYKHEKCTENLIVKFKKDNQKIIVLTLHRREGQLKLIPQVLEEVNKIVDDIGCQIVFPVHTNPNIQKAIDKLELNDRIHCINNLVYHEFVWWNKNPRSLWYAADKHFLNLILCITSQREECR